MTYHPYILMQREVRESPQSHDWPAGTRPALFAPDIAREAHALLDITYASGGGHVPDLAA